MSSLPHLVLGTSGHVDHGKTTLVQALTGIDADRLAEEKRRGITIDLGFAHMELESIRIAFVDVPGHERFVHNMLAGISGLDAVLLVIAADEGVMPQTREHLHICRLLGVQLGLLVLTRCDKVDDPEMLDLCADEVRELVKDTFLAEAPLLQTSAKTGEGLDELRNALLQIASKTHRTNSDCSFRLDIDRSFGIKGFGTVVTGTVRSGNLKLEEEVWQWPLQHPRRIRSLQVHGTPVEQIWTGERAAINLSQISVKEIQRGDQLAAANSLLTSYLLDGELEVLEDLLSPLRHRERVQLHLGSASVPARLIPLEEAQLAPGETRLVQLRLERELSSRHGDRFLIRGRSPLRTLGGGTVLDAAPNKSRRLQQERAQRLRQLSQGSLSEQIQSATWLQGLRGTSLAELALRTPGSAKALQKEVAGLLSRQVLVQAGQPQALLFHQEHLERVGRFMQRQLAQQHHEFPERAGLPVAAMQGKLHRIFPLTGVSEGLLKFFERQQLCSRRGEFYALPSHQAQQGETATTQLEALLELLKEGSFQPLRQTQLLEQAGLDERTALPLLKQAAFHKQLVRVAEDLWYLPLQLERFREQLQQWFSTHETISVIECKELLQTGRRHALELLEYADRQYWTRRIDNHRVPAKLLY